MRLIITSKTGEIGEEKMVKVYKGKAVSFTEPKSTIMNRRIERIGKQER